MIDADIYENPTLNIGIIGCISSGKSTLMNSLFSETYSDMKIKKTTMCPQVYKTDRKLIKNKTYAKSIRKQNEEINKKLYEEGVSNKCEEVTYNVLPIPDIFDKLKHGKSIEYKIYDIPGLNDSVTKNKFYDYIKNNFYKFDIVIYNVDINSGLNTTDELDILNLIKSCIEETQKKYNNNVNLMIICNKCDDLTENDKGELIGSEEIEEMYQQVCDIAKANNINCPILKYSAAYTYMYRSINTPENIDIEYINKIGIDNFGRVPWAKQSKGKSVDQLWELIKPHLSDSSSESLVLSGFEQFKKVICNNILFGKLLDIMYSKINFNMVESDFMAKYNFIKKLDEIFGSNDIGNKKMSEYLKAYFGFLDKTYKFDSINDSNCKLADDYFKIILDLKKLDLPKKDLAKIKELIDIHNKKKADFDIEIIKSSKEIAVGDIFSKLHQIVEKTDDGIKKLSQADILEKLQRVPIEDFYKMIMYLYNNNMNHTTLVNIYASKLINIINKSEYCSMVKNYIMKLYFDSGDELYNWMSCCIKVSVLLSPFNKEIYYGLIMYLSPFIKFYNLKNKSYKDDSDSESDSDNSSDESETDSKKKTVKVISKQKNKAD